MPEDKIFEGNGGDEKINIDDIIKQWAKNLKFKSDGKANPRGIASNVVTGLNPAVGLASSIPFSLIFRSLFGSQGSIKDLLGIGPDNKFGVMDLGKEGVPEGGGGAEGVGDVASILGLLTSTPGVDESLGPPSTFAEAQGPSPLELYAKLLNDAGYFSASGDPLDPSQRNILVGAGSNRSFDPFGGGAGPGAGRGGPGQFDMRALFGGRFGSNVGSFGGGGNRGIGSSLFKF
jgi:hypothetical protein